MRPSAAPRLPALLLAMLCALLLAWYGWLRPPAWIDPRALLVLLLLPAVPGLLLGALRRPSAAFWCGVASLFYFSHGVMEAWTVPAVRGLAAAEIALALAIILAASWPGLRARAARRRAARNAPAGPV